jgi:hypothetical protein
VRGRPTSGQAALYMDASRSAAHALVGHL